MATVSNHRWASFERNDLAAIRARDTAPEPPALGSDDLVGARRVLDAGCRTLDMLIGATSRLQQEIDLLRDEIATEAVRRARAARSRDDELVREAARGVPLTDAHRSALAEARLRLPRPSRAGFAAQ